MLKPKLFRFTLLVALLAFSVLRGYGAGVIYATPGAEKAPVIAGNALLESKGLVEPAIEIGHGGSFQQQLFKIKKSGGDPASLSVKLKPAHPFTTERCSCFSEFLSVPRYLFNRSLLI